MLYYFDLCCIGLTRHFPIVYCDAPVSTRNVCTHTWFIWLPLWLEDFYKSINHKSVQGYRGSTTTLDINNWSTGHCSSECFVHLFINSLIIIYAYMPDCGILVQLRFSAKPLPDLVLPLCQGEPLEKNLSKIWLIYIWKCLWKTRYIV